MRLLILGGTQFLGRAIAAHACAMGHDVTCAARGVAGTVPYRARFIRVDRDEPDGLAPLAGKEFVNRTPRTVKESDVRRPIGNSPPSQMIFSSAKLRGGTYVPASLAADAAAPENGTLLTGYNIASEDVKTPLAAVPLPWMT